MCTAVENGGLADGGTLTGWLADLELRTLDDVDVGLRDGFSEVVVVVVGGGAVPLGGNGLCLVLAFDVGGEVAAVAAMA